MISAVTSVALPELIVDKQNGVQIDIGLNGEQGLNENVDNLSNKDSESFAKQKEFVEKKFDQKTVDKLNNELREFLENNDLETEILFEKEDNRLVVKWLDSGTKEVVKQVPAEYMLKIARMISNQMEGGALADAKI